MTRIPVFIIAIAMLAGSVAAQTDTTFTYQGELTESGTPANGSYNMDFALWDALSGGNQVGSTIQFIAQSVTDGLFTVRLDFGADVFDGSQLWLAITVDGSELVPRQPLTGAPFALQMRGIVVDADNNVGIGTSSPACELEVANVTPGTGAEAAVTADDAAGAIAAYSSTLPPPFEHYAGRVSLFSDAATMGLDLRADAYVGDIPCYTGGFAASNERMRITSTGNVGIGTSDPSSRLSVGGDGLSNVAIWGEGTGSENIGVTGYTASADGLGVLGWASERGVKGQAWGNDGVGLMGEGLGSSGHGVRGYGGQWDFYAANADSGNYGAASSIRWKRNIVEIDKPLERVAALRGVYFEWDAEHGGQHDVGMIAEEVGAVLPEIVTYEENGIDANGMDYSKLTPLLVEAINALRAEKDAEIELLRADNDILRARIDALEQLVERIASAEQEEIAK